MQFDFRLKKYLNKKAEKDWKLVIKPPQKIYDSFIVVPAKAESKNIPNLLESISNQNKEYLKRCLTIIVVNNSTDDSKDIINGLKPFQQNEVVENLNHLYSNAHCIRYQTRWFKGSRDRGLKSDIAA